MKIATLPKETLNKSLARSASLLWAHRFVKNARHIYGDVCAFLLARHPKPKRAASRELIQCFLGAISFACFSFLPSTAAAQVNKDLPIVDMQIKGHKLKAEVAADANSRTIGLMNRFSLKPDCGMLFVFASSEPLAFWMKNTFVPLSIAYVDAKGIILNIADMKPQDESTHPSKGPAMFALEMKLGWFKERGIAAGDKLEGLDKAGRAKS